MQDVIGVDCLRDSPRGRHGESGRVKLAESSFQGYSNDKTFTYVVPGNVLEKYRIIIEYLHQRQDTSVLKL